MSIWSMLNWLAWAASAIIFLLMICDFIRVEKERLKT